MQKGILSKYVIPQKFKHIRKTFQSNSFLMLDVGCANFSCKLAKSWFPKVIYHGVDRTYNSILHPDYKMMDRFFEVDLEKTVIDVIPDNSYDAIIMSHVIEHLDNGLTIIKSLSQKLRTGGIIYIEFPSVRSLSLPHADGTLHFCDDPTHKRLYTVIDIANTMLSCNIRIIKAGKKREKTRLLLSPIAIVFNMFYYLRHRKFSARGMWDITGFADYVLGIKR